MYQKSMFGPAYSFNYEHIKFSVRIKIDLLESSVIFSSWMFSSDRLYTTKTYKQQLQLDMSTIARSKTMVSITIQRIIHYNLSER